MSTTAATTLRELVLETFLFHSDRVALTIEDRSWTYGELLDHAIALARRLDAEVLRGRSVGIWCHRDLLSLTGILAAVISERPYVPLNPTFPPARIEAIVRAARPGMILASDDVWTAAGALAAGTDASTAILGEGGAVLRGSAIDLAPPDDCTESIPDRTTYIMFTSGTTGTPKGVRILERNLLAYLSGIQELVTIGAGDRATHFFDLSFDLSVHDLFVTWLSGAELCVLPRSQSMSVPDFVRTRRITHWFSVPSLAAYCDRLGQLGPGAMPSLRSVLFCGEALPTTLARTFLAAAPHAVAWNIYGPTEATIAFTAFQLSGGMPDQPVVPVGRPFGKNSIRLDPAEWAEGEVAELLLGGPQISPGYINTPDQNALRFSSDGKDVHWYRTGDLVRWSDDHGLLFLGRVDDQVKLNGYRVELAEIDAALRLAAGTSEVAALPWPVSEAGHADQIIGFVVKPEATPAEIRSRCRIHLPEYMVPRRIVVIDAMPVTSSGKIDRNALRAKIQA